MAKAPSEALIPLVLLARVFEEAGLPAGVLNVITGPGSEIGDLLASHSDISMISFTGSTSVGRSIAAGAGPKPMHLELGGNAAGIVLADADLDVAVEKTVSARSRTPASAATPSAASSWNKACTTSTWSGP